MSISFHIYTTAESKYFRFISFIYHLYQSNLTKSNLSYRYLLIQTSEQAKRHTHPAVLEARTHRSIMQIPLIRQESWICQEPGRSFSSGPRPWVLAAAMAIMWGWRCQQSSGLIIPESISMSQFPGLHLGIWHVDWGYDDMIGHCLKFIQILGYS